MKYVGLDLECTGLYPVKGRDKIFCVAINDGRTTKVYERIEDVRKICEDKSICKVIHNAAFDIFWLKVLYNIDVTNIWCTYNGEKIIIGDNYRGEKNSAIEEALSASLEFTLLRYGFPVHDKTVSASFATRPHNKPLTPKEIELVKNDVKWLLHIQAIQAAQLAKLDQMRVMGLENELVEVVRDMRVRGIGFDAKRWREIAAANELERNRRLKRLPATVANWNSPAQVKKYFNSRGIPVESLTNIEELQPIYNDPVLNDFISTRELYKAVTTYGTNWLEDSVKGNTVDADGRIRSDFDQIINTGRFASSHPNLQNIPRGGDFLSCFVPRKGYSFIYGDYSGQELCIMAAASKETFWLDWLLQENDPHALKATIFYEKEWAKGKLKSCAFPKKCKCPEHQYLRNEKIKTIGFAFEYGSSLKEIAKKLGFDWTTTIRLANKYKSRTRKLNRYMQQNADFSIRTRTSFSADPYKRRRTLRDPQDWMLSNIGKNNPIQACGANMLKLAMISLPKGTPIVLTIHDSLVLEVPNREVNKWCKVLKGTMEKAADYCTSVKGLVKVEPKIKKSL